jgi:hypothetical protein
MNNATLSVKFMGDLVKVANQLGIVSAINRIGTEISVLQQSAIPGWSKQRNVSYEPVP